MMVFMIVTFMPMAVFVRMVMVVVIVAAFVLVVLVAAFMLMIVAFMLVFIVRMNVSVNLAMFIGFLVLIVRMNRSRVYPELDPVDVLSFIAREVHVEISDFHLRQFPLESGRLDAEVAQGTYGHVAADAGKTIEKKDPHDALRKLAA